MPQQPANTPWWNTPSEIDEGEHPTPPPPSELDEAEHRAPQGEPVPEDTAPQFTGPPPRSPDVYWSDGVTVADVQQARPRWSAARCRAWLVRQEGIMQSRSRDRLLRHMHELLNTEAPPLNRDRELGRPRRADGLRIPQPPPPGGISDRWNFITEATQQISMPDMHRIYGQYTIGSSSTTEREGG